MAKGNFIALGDKTTCGGSVVEGDTHINMFGFAHAREGHQVTCGVTGRVYTIIGGIERFTSNGRKAAGTLHSFSSCPCRAKLIPSISFMTYDYEDDPLPAGSQGRDSSQPGNDFRPAPAATAAHSASRTPQDLDIERCSGAFQLVDQWNMPCPTHDYALLRNGACLAGDTLNPEGYSHICYSAQATHLNVATSAPAPLLE
ncbi:PAAR domain-containing protein [Pseudomonas japonica]|uniref:PAAR motif-containing protein n=1 Tax=Pseudomonas japonica TaxID=256466 RepID=A0A239DS71_9PSED|nr:PAAR domain-containing protein [Pseudomonas japonica]SNS34778.1 PAAR motif-containing protein [Pseudomonas japonica]